jgi:hypothetical protein
METLKRYLKYCVIFDAGLFIGMAAWIMLETTHIAPPVCVVEQSLYDSASSSNTIDAKVKRKN